MADTGKPTVTDDTADASTPYVVLPKPGTARVAHVRLDGSRPNRKRRGLTGTALCGVLANTHYGHTYREPAPTGRTLVPFLEAFPLPLVGYEGYSPHGTEGLRLCPKCLGLLLDQLDITQPAIDLITARLTPTRD